MTDAVITYLSSIVSLMSNNYYPGTNLSYLSICIGCFGLLAVFSTVKVIFGIPSILGVTTASRDYGRRKRHGGNDDDD